ncbi:MAG TPA: hypothetical protein VLH19_02970 [Patescibacteria group bacterium]|nr:hypothetical protein [Patescibacteria group bacterium]
MTIDHLECTFQAHFEMDNNAEDTQDLLVCEGKVHYHAEGGPMCEKHHDIWLSWLQQAKIKRGEGE